MAAKRRKKRKKKEGAEIVHARSGLRVGKAAFFRLARQYLEGSFPPESADFANKFSFRFLFAFFAPFCGYPICLNLCALREIFCALVVAVLSPFCG
jgi:hypothetical protein